MKKTFKPLLILAFLGCVLVPFQNCSMYKSEGRAEFDQALRSANPTSCLPYIDSNIVATAINSTQGLYVTQETDSVSGATVCSFTAVAGAAISMVVCDISVSNRDNAMLSGSLDIGSDDVLDPNGRPSILQGAGLLSAPSDYVGYFSRPTTTLPQDNLNGNAFAWTFTNAQENEYAIRYYAYENGASAGAGCTLTVPIATHSATITTNSVLNTYVKPLQKITETIAKNIQ